MSDLTGHEYLVAEVREEWEEAWFTNDLVCAAALDFEEPARCARCEWALPLPAAMVGVAWCECCVEARVAEMEAE